MLCVLLGSTPSGKCHLPMGYAGSSIALELIEISDCETLEKKRSTPLILDQVT
jgi:hypothetical protein